MSNPTILIVEDEAIISKDIANRLRRLGYAVVGATDTGEKAIEIARRLRPSLVLMDIRLAGAMDGVIAADTIRKECQLPVVFMTAYSDKATIQRAGQVQAFGYIMKPFDDRELHVQIEMSLSKHTAELRLIESESRLREVLENSLDASYKRNLQTDSFDYLSPAFARISAILRMRSPTYR
jgi:CheY-like chemotaxis protein